MKILVLSNTLVLIVAMLGRVCAADFGSRVPVVVVAAIQGKLTASHDSMEHRPGWYDEALSEAAKKGVHFVVLPEWRTPAVAEEIPGPTTQDVGAQARKFKMWIAVSIFEKADRPSGGHYVTLVLLDPKGQIAATQRKRTSRRSGDNGTTFIAGSPWEPPDSIDAGGYRIGLLSGDDLRIGVPRLSGRGATTILVAAEWDLGEPVDWKALCEMLAREHGVNLVVANRVPGVGGIFRPNGEIISATANSGIAVQGLPDDGQLLRPPLGLPAVPIPAGYAYSEELVSLGRDLFFDASLSTNRKLSCASCHDPTLAFSNGKPRGVGAGNITGARNVPSLLNVAYRSLLHWDGSSASLELQTKFPMSHVHELDSHYLELLARVRNRADYARRFAEVGISVPIEFEDIARALATYQRSLLSGNSPFDRYLYGHESSALSPSARRGLELFRGKAGCVSCHVIGDASSLLADNEFHNTGVGYTSEGFPDLGWGGVSYGHHSGMFVTPSLRNIALTAPYMHDGSILTLEEVIDFYDGGGGKNPDLDTKIKPLQLTELERKDLDAFLRSLTGDQKFTPTGEPIFTDGENSSGTIAAVQFNAEPGALERNRESLRRLVWEAADNGAGIIVLPEYAETGRVRDVGGASRYSPSSEKLFKDSLRTYQRWSVTLGVWLVVTVLDPADHVVSLLIDDRGVIRTRHNKVRVRNQGRDAGVLPGKPVSDRSVSSPFGRVGVMSGDDVDTGISRLAQLGTELVLVSASWETSDAIDWRRLIRDRGRQHGVQVVVANLGDSTRGPITAPVTLNQATKYADRIDYFPLARSSAGSNNAPRPLGLPPLPKRAKTTGLCVELGRKLFFDPGFSHDGKTSCSSCHDPRLAFTDRRVLPEGVFARVGKRNTLSLLNAAYRPVLFWDGRAASLEDQIDHSIAAWAEMDSDPHRLVQYVKSSNLDGNVPGEDKPIASSKFPDLAKCIADYERTLLSANSPFDRFYFGSDRGAISESARHGFEVFRTKGGCISCHRVNPREAMFTDNEFHNTGIGFHERFLYLGYGGDGLASEFASRDQFLGEYLTPSLRNVALTPPYMHDGSLATLDDVVSYYDGGGAHNNPFQDTRIRPLGLAANEKSDLIFFLETLNGDHQYDSGGVDIKVWPYSND